MFPLWRSAVLFAIATALLSIAVSFPVSSDQTTSTIWLATHTAAHRVDTATNRIAATFPLPQEAEAMAADATLGSVWVLAHKRLYHFDAATTGLLAEFDLKRLSAKLEDSSRLLLNPYDGSLWVAGEKSLLHIDSLGRVLLDWQASEKITTLAVALDESLWLTTKKDLLQLSASGTTLTRVSLAGPANEPLAIAVDNIGGALWLADDKTLLKLNLKDLSQPPAVVYQSKDEAKEKADDGHLTQLGLDPMSGRLWLATKTRILSFDRAGTSLAAAMLPADLKETEALLYDSASQSLWLGTKKELVRLSDSGAVLARLDIDNELEAAATAPFQLTPQLSLLAPPDGLLTNNPRPTMRLGLSALCQDTPCAPAASYFGSFNLNATLNGSPVGNLFSLGGTEAAYTPSERLPEGLNLFSAQATDTFAHLSNTVQARFTVDTIPPKFLSLTPADSSVVNTQPITISGSLDDPTATVILENMALIGASVVDGNPQQFSFKVLLKDGPNAFVLIARDPAGNEARATLHLTYSAVSVNLTNITSGAVVNTDRLLVMGTFRGPPNTGVTVNGVVAETYGDKFYVNNFPLNPGPNTLTAMATTPGGLSATDTVTVTVNSTDPGPIEVNAEPQSGIAPLAVSFTVRSNTTLPLIRLTADFNGDGVTDFTTTNPNALIEHTYSTPGVYQATVTATDGQNRSTSQLLAIVVHDPQQLNQLFVGLWSGMNEALKAGDTAKAASFLNESAKARYRPVFEALKPHMAEIVASYSPPARVSVSQDIGEYAVVRLHNGQKRVYLIYFLKDADGVWRVDGM